MDRVILALEIVSLVKAVVCEYNLAHNRAKERMGFNMKTLTKKYIILYIVMALGFALSACSNTGTLEHAASLAPEETKTPPQDIAPIDPVDFEIETLKRNDIVPGSFDIPPIRIYSCIDVSSYGYDERFYEYQTIDLYADSFLEDALKQLEIHGQISVDAMWYEGKRLCIDLNRTMFDRLNAGSSAGYFLSNELLLTFASFPNTEEIVFTINGEESWGDHFNLFYIFPVSDSLQEMHDHAIARFSW